MAATRAQYGQNGGREMYEKGNILQM